MSAYDTILATGALTPDQRQAALTLARECNQLEGLTLKLNTTRGPEGMPANMWLAYQGGALLGYCALDGGIPEAELCGMVAPAHRRKGVGRALLDAVMDACRTAGVSRLLLICEDASASGRAFVGAITARHSFSEAHMEMDAPAQSLPAGPLVVREATLADAHALAEVTVEAFGGSVEGTAARMADELRSGDGQYLLGFAEGRPVAALKLYLSEGHAGIYAFGVRQDARSKGYGRATLAQAAEMARSRGFPRLYLEVDSDNHVARSLYDSFGFQLTTTYGYYVVSF